MDNNYKNNSGDNYCQDTYPSDNGCQRQTDYPQGGGYPPANGYQGNNYPRSSYPQGGYSQNNSPGNNYQPNYYNQPPQYMYPPRQQEKKGTVGFGVTALVMGILSVVFGLCFYFVGIPFAVLGVIFGLVGMIVKGGRGMAAAGFILSVVTLVGGYFFWLWLSENGIWDMLRSANQALIFIMS